MPTQQLIGGPLNGALLHTDEWPPAERLEMRSGWYERVSLALNVSLLTPAQANFGPTVPRGAEYRWHEAS